MTSTHTVVPAEGTGSAAMALYAAPDRTAPKGTVAFHAWRGRALSDAAARRELWRIHHRRSTAWLRRELAGHEFRAGDYCRRLNGENSARVALWYARLIRTELRRRGASATLTRQGAQS
jgi:hypothetical protein